MKPLSIAVVILAAALAVGACKNRREEPIPGPKALSPSVEVGSPRDSHPASSSGPEGTATRPGSSDRRHGSSGISWFQGTVEEAFSTTCSKCTAMFLREALDR